MLRKKNCQRACLSRLTKSVIKLVVALILFGASLMVIKASGGFDDQQSFTNFVLSVTANWWAALLTGLPGFVAAIWGAKDLLNRSDVEVRNKDGMKMIDDRVTDLNFSKKDWKAAKKGRPLANRKTLKAR